MLDAGGDNQDYSSGWSNHLPLSTWLFGSEVSLCSSTGPVLSFAAEFRTASWYDADGPEFRFEIGSAQWRRSFAVAPDYWTGWAIEDQRGFRLAVGGAAVVPDTWYSLRVTVWPLSGQCNLLVRNQTGGILTSIKLSGGAAGFGASATAPLATDEGVPPPLLLEGRRALLRKGRRRQEGSEEPASSLAACAEPVASGAVARRGEVEAEPRAGAAGAAAGAVAGAVAGRHATSQAATSHRIEQLIVSSSTHVGRERH